MKYIQQKHDGVVVNICVQGREVLSPGLTRHYHQVATLGKLLNLNCLGGVQSSAMTIGLCYCLYDPEFTVVHVRHLLLSLRVFVRAYCGLLVVLIKRKIIINEKVINSKTK